MLGAVCFLRYYFERELLVSEIARESGVHNSTGFPTPIDLPVPRALVTHWSGLGGAQTFHGALTAPLSH